MVRIRQITIKVCLNKPNKNSLRSQITFETQQPEDNIGEAGNGFGRYDDGQIVSFGNACY